MGVSTDGQICYGVKFEEGYEFPWDNEAYNTDIENWWRVISGYKPSVEIYDSEGEYIGGQEPAESIINAYYRERREFDKMHFLPLTLVNYCGGDCPMYILAINRTCLSSNRGDPVWFKPEELTVTDEERAALLVFCETHGLEFEGEPEWYLSSYWG